MFEPIVFVPEKENGEEASFVVDVVVVGGPPPPRAPPPLDNPLTMKYGDPDIGEVAPSRPPLGKEGGIGFFSTVEGCCRAGEREGGFRVVPPGAPCVVPVRWEAGFGVVIGGGILESSSPFVLSGSASST